MTTTNTPSLQSRRQLGAGPLDPTYTDALFFAADHHRDQLRKGSRVPYLTHLMSVSALVLENGGSQEQGIAALLHDAVEDAPKGEGPAVLTAIEKRFGPHVAAIVRAWSDGLNDTGVRSGSWAARKTAYFASFAHKEPDALLVTAADKTHNSRCIVADLRIYGTGFISTFGACAHQLLWYYDAVYAQVAARLANPLVEELGRTIEVFHGLLGIEHAEPEAAPPVCLECGAAE